MSQSAFPKALAIHQLKKKAISSRCYRANVHCESGSVFPGGSSMLFDLPILSRSYVDPSNMYLKFKLKFKAAPAAATFLDKSAHSLIARIVQSSGGNILSDVSSYGQLAAALMDLQCPASQQTSDNNLTIGSGLDAKLPNKGIAVTEASDVTFCIPLFTGLNSCQRMLSLDTQSPIRYQFYLASAVQAFFSETVAGGAGIPQYEITEPELICNITEISQEASVLLNQAISSAGYNVFMTDYSVITQQIPQASSKVIHNLAFRFSALSSVMIVQQVSSNESDGTNNGVSNRSRNKLKSYKFIVGGQSMPSSGVQISDTNLGEALNETQISFGLMSDLVNTHCLNHVNATNEASENYKLNYGVTALTAGDAEAKPMIAATQGSFVCALDLDTFKTPLSDENFYSGLNVQSSSISCELAFEGTTTSSCIATYFARYEAIVSLDDVSNCYVASV